MTDHAANRDLTAPLRAAMYAGERVRDALAVFADDATIHMCHPFGDLTGPQAFFDTCYAPLRAAMPDLERRDWIVVAGTDEQGNDWVGTGTTWMGTFLHPFLDIPPTGHLAHMRAHEYYRIVEGRIVEMQAIWDIPELMMQARAWPMSPSLGREWHVPGPATLDGVREGQPDEAEAQATRQHILDMLTAMTRHPREPEEAMEMPRYWHPHVNWYGPAGIGTGRGIPGFRHWHQMPFLAAMPDRGMKRGEMTYHFFADGPYAAVTGWPNMKQRITGDGWLGIAAAGQELTMRSLDFWRLEDGLIRENWVLVDLLDMYRQLGVDVLARMREFNKARPTGAPPIAKAYADA